MSDTDDGFDEEAVRRELREKYEDDDRAETERMSELLLQGATMTNQHCDACSSPIFRYDGQAFCPNCQQAGGQTPDGQATDDQTASGQPTGDQQAQGGDRARGGQQAQSGQQARPDQQSASENADVAAQDADVERRQQTSQTDRDGADADRGPAAGGESAGRPQAGAASGEAADALESSISALARRAAGSDDPRTAREYLEAAREAAEALAALRRNA